MRLSRVLLQPVVGSVTVSEGTGANVEVTGLPLGKVTNVLVWGRIIPSQTPGGLL